VRPRYLVPIVLAAAASLAALVIAVKALDDSGDDPTVSAPPPRFRGEVVAGRPAAPHLSLRDQNGRPVDGADLRGRPAVVAFLPARCGALCVLTVNQIKGALDDLRSRPRALAVSIDPDSDSATARRLLTQTGMRGRLRVLLGGREQLAPVWRGFGVTPRGQRDGKTAQVVLLDRSGAQRIRFTVAQLTPERLAHDLRILEGE
jgi:protein SCO1